MTKDDLGRVLEESNASITEALTGRTVDHVIRDGLQLKIVTSCGHVVVLQADVNHNIHHIRTDVQIVLPSVSVDAIAGKL